MVTAKSGDRLIDFSYARPPHAAARSAGAVGLIRYSAGAASNPNNGSYNLNRGKLITPAEFASIIHDGFDIVANSEWYTTRVTERLPHDPRASATIRGLEVLFTRAHRDLSTGGGAVGALDVAHADVIDYLAAAGTADGIADAELWHRCGYNHGASIFCSWDAAPSPVKYPAVAAYLRHHQAAMGGMYHTDLYAGTPVLRWMLAQGVIRYGWRPNAGSWSNDGIPYQPGGMDNADRRDAYVAAWLSRTPARLVQTGGYWFGTSADENVALRVPFGSHLQNAAKPKPPPPKPPVPPTPPRPPINPNPEADLNENETTRLVRREIVDAMHALMTGDESDYYTADRFPNWVHRPAKGTHVGGLRAWMGRVSRKLGGGVDW